MRKSPVPKSVNMRETSLSEKILGLSAGLSRTDSQRVMFMKSMLLLARMLLRQLTATFPLSPTSNGGRPPVPLGRLPGAPSSS